MANKAGLIARMFGRSQNTVVSKLYTHALGQPLFVHPQIGERLLGAYLEGAVDNQAAAPMQESSGRIAIINISGGLVNRPMPDACGPGPLSYSDIRAVFDAAMSDSNVSAIVMRMDSPGGFAAGLCDLTDHIFESRGTKPIVAQIDDMAYSAAYGIAAACDRIQVTRTGGGGSIGTFTYHVDASGANAQAGVKVTYIFAGQKKVDGNWDEPLSDSARADMQSRIDQHYALFTSSVAKYRGTDADKIVATQAGCYEGPSLVAAGLADSIGTLEQLLIELSTDPKPLVPAGAENGDDEMPDAPEDQNKQPAAVAAGDPAAPAAADEQAANTALAAKDAEKTGELIAHVDAPAKFAAYALMLAQSELPAALVKAMLKSGVVPTSDEEVANSIAHAQQVNDLCAAAHLESCASDYVARGITLEQVRSELQGAVADTKDEIVTALPKAGESQSKAGGLSPNAIYQDRNSRHLNRGKKNDNA